jgi:hypothetical protein
MNSFIEQKQAIAAEAGIEFLAANQDLNNVSAYMRAEKLFKEAAIEKWFLEGDSSDSVVVTRNTHVVEIRDEYYGSTISVHPPQRRCELGDKISVQPAYINASTWCTGSYNLSVAHVQRRTQNYLKMMEIALETQNEMNQPLTDWPNMPNPFAEARRDRESLEVFRSRELKQIHKQQEKRAAKQAK